MKRVVWGSDFRACSQPRPFHRPNIPLPLELNGVSFTVEGKAAPLLYVWPTQVNALVLSEIPVAAGQTRQGVPVVVKGPGGASALPIRRRIK